MAGANLCQMANLKNRFDDSSVTDGVRSRQCVDDFRGRIKSQPMKDCGVNIDWIDIVRFRIGGKCIRFTKDCAAPNSAAAQPS